MFKKLLHTALVCLAKSNITPLFGIGKHLISISMITY